jgi:hypothetical protein
VNFPRVFDTILDITPATSLSETFHEKTLARAGGGWRFARPDGREFDLPHHDPAASAVDWTALRDTHAQLGIEIDSDTAATRWRGERMDYELGVWVLCQEHARAQHGHQIAAQIPN